MCVRVPIDRPFISASLYTYTHTLTYHTHTYLHTIRPCSWVECVGHADRSAYDLKVHSAKSKVDLQAHVVYDEPRMVTRTVVKPNHSVLGRTFKRESKKVVTYLKVRARACMRMWV